MQPVKPIHVDVVGIHPRFSRLLIVRVVLEPKPSARWCALFQLAEADLPGHPDFRPKLADGIITLTLPDEALEQDVALVEQCIRLVNARMLLQTPGAVDLAPLATARSSQAAQPQAFSSKAQHRIEEAQAAANRLSGAFLSAEWEPVEPAPHAADE